MTRYTTYASMHSWFALNLLYPAVIEVKGIHQFDWLTRENIPVLEAVENHNGVRNYYHGYHFVVANLSDTTPRTFASKFQARSPKYISLLNHLRIYLPEDVDAEKQQRPYLSSFGGYPTDVYLTGSGWRIPDGWWVWVANSSGWQIIFSNIRFAKSC